MKEIALTQGQKAIIDDDDFDKLSDFGWYALKTKSGFYAVKAMRFGGTQRNFLLHREIMDPPPGFSVDHKNGNTLDNRRENLRIVSHQQNMMNRKIHKNNVVGIKGIRLEGKKWRARIWINGDQIHLGLFNNLQDAKNARNLAELKHFGEFRRCQI